MGVWVGMPHVLDQEPIKLIRRRMKPGIHRLSENTNPHCVYIKTPELVRAPSCPRKEIKSGVGRAGGGVDRSSLPPAPPIDRSNPTDQLPDRLGGEPPEPLVNRCCSLVISRMRGATVSGSKSHWRGGVEWREWITPDSLTSYRDPACMVVQH